MVEDSLGSSVLEDNLEIGLGFGDDNQKIEKMNQSFLLLKKKLFRSHDLIQQYSNKMTECERLRIEMQNTQKEVEKYKQQHLTNAAKVVKLNMHNSVLEENNKKLEKRVTEQEIKIAGDQRHVQQLICKVEDIEDRHSEKVMQIELEKSGLQVKIKELEQEIKNIQKLNGTGTKKLEKKGTGPGSKRKGKNEGLTSPKFKSQTTSGDLGLINEEDPSNSEVLQCLNEEISEKKSSDIPQEVISNTKLPEKPEKTYKDVGVNVSIDITPPKPVMLEKNVMTDDFYRIKDNPYPLFCDECEKMLEPMPVDAICRTMTRLPPRISQISTDPERDNSFPLLNNNDNDNEEITTINHDQSSPTVLDSLQRRIKILEKKIKRKSKAENTRQSCCNHSHTSSCCNTQNLIPNQQMQMMEFFNRIMQFPGMMRKKKKKKRKPNKKLCHHQQFKKTDAKLTRSPKKKKRKSVNNNNNSNNNNNWDVEPENTEQFDDDAMDMVVDNRSSSTPKLRTPPSRNLISYKERREFEEQAPEEISSRNSRSPVRPIHDNHDVPASSRADDEVINPRKRKRREESNNTVAKNRSNILKNLRRLKTKKSLTAVVAHKISATKEPAVGAENAVSTSDIIPLKRRRIAHIPRKIEEDAIPLSNVNNDEQSLQPEKSPPKVDDLEEKRITRSSKRSIVKRNEKTDDLFKSSENETNSKNLGNQSDTSHEESEIQKSSSVENSEKIEENPEMLKDGNIEEDDKITEIEPATSSEPSEPSNPEDSAPLHAPTDPIAPENDLETTSECSDNLEQAKDSSENVRELRNRQVNVSQSLIAPPTPKISRNRQKSESVEPGFQSEKSGMVNIREGQRIKSKSMTPTRSNSSEALPHLSDPTLNNFQSTEKIEVLLERHLESTKKKRGRKPKTFEVSKIIYKKTENIVKEQLSRLINSGDWDDEIYSSVSMNLSNIKSARTIAKAVVDFIAERSDVKETLDCTYTPPAPPMTRSQQLIVTLLKDLDTRIPELIEMTFTAIEFALFRMNSSPEWNAVENLARIFTVLARMKKDRERVRIMCIDALYCLQKKSMIIIHTAITCWPEVLPMYNEEKNEFLVITIIQIMRMYQSESKINQIKKLISAYYNYPEIDPSSAKLACRVIESLANNYNKSDEAAIILLCKKEGTEWMYKNVVYGGLMEMIVKHTCSSMFDSLKLVGFLIRSLPVTDGEGRVSEIIKQLRALVESKDSPAEIQEGAVSALLSLSRHGFDNVAKSVLNWLPPRALPPLLHEQLNSFFGARTDRWSMIKSKCRRYADRLESHG